MTARAGRRLKEEVDTWAAEMRLLLEACRVLIEYFGTKGDLTGFEEPYLTVAERFLALP